MRPSPCCPTTGEPNCHCDTETRSKIHLAARPRDTSRKLFTDHAVYTKFYINTYLDNSPDADVVRPRLLANQNEIGTFFGDYLGDKAGVAIAKLFTEHIKAVAGFLTSVRNGQDTAANLAAIRDNIAQVAQLVSTAPGTTLTYDVVFDEFQRHNQFVIEMSIDHYNGNHDIEYQKYDQYYNHMMYFSDLLVQGLIH